MRSQLLLKAYHGSSFRLIETRNLKSVLNYGVQRTSTPPLFLTRVFGFDSVLAWPGGKGAEAYASLLQRAARFMDSTTSLINYPPLGRLRSSGPILL